MIPTADTTIAQDVSIADLRALMGPPPSQEKTETPDAKPAAPVEEKPEAATGTAEEKPKEDDKQHDDVEPELPKGVIKRIEKETAKQAEIQRKIDHARSLTLAKEEELRKLEPGTAPVKNAAPAAATSAGDDPKDQEPQPPKFGEDGQTWGQYQDAMAAHKTEHDAWLVRRTERMVEQKLTAKFESERKQQESQKAWESAIGEQVKAGSVKDKTEFTALVEKAQANAPEGLQLAISSLENWAGVAVYLGKNEARLKEVAAEYERNPFQAIATLGRIEASLKTSPSTTKPLPNPPARAGGSGNIADSGAFDWANASVDAVRREMQKARTRE